MSEHAKAHKRISTILLGNVPVGSTLSVHGWLRTRRDSKAGFSFLQLNDGSHIDNIQIVADAQLDNYSSEILQLSPGCAVRATGRLVGSSGKGQSVELQAEQIEVVGWVDDPDTYPIQPKRHSMEFLRGVAHLRPRTNTFGAVARVRNTLASAVHDFLQQQGFLWVHTPIITAADAEGAGELFRVSTLDLQNLPRDEHNAVDFSQDFFGKETYLTVSGQLNVETYCQALDRVYTFGPTFRAENSNTSRHLAEFWMVEPEIAFADLDDLAELAEGMLKHLFSTVLEENAADIDFFSKQIDKDCHNRLTQFLNHPFERMDYSEVIDVLKSSGVNFEYPVEWGIDLQSEHERWLAETYVGRPVIVQNYPRDIKAFYMRCNDDGRTVAALDVLAPGIGEIIGGAQREERLDQLDQRMQECGIDGQRYNWYRDLRRYGSTPHAGFGMGFERIIAYATGMNNVRDVIPFPRTPRNAPF